MFGSLVGKVATFAKPPNVVGNLRKPRTEQHSLIQKVSLRHCSFLSERKKILSIENKSNRNMKNPLKLILRILLLTLVCSCAIQKPTYRANNSKRIIIIENDSTLRHTELIGCLGNSNTLTYKNENGFLKVSGNEDTKQVGIFSLATDLYGSELIIEKDSLIVKRTGEIFYEDRFLKSKDDQKFQEFYIVVDDKEKKITKSNFKRILTNPDLENYTSFEMDKDEAKKKYGIDKKYKTLKLVRK